MRRPTLRDVGAVLFDVDGVLIDSYSAYRDVWGRWCDARNVDFEVAWAATHGRRPVETIAEVAPHLDSATEYEELQSILSSAAHPFEGYPTAARLLATLPGGSWGVVTSGDRATVLARFSAAGFPLPDVLVDGSDVARGKPAPEGYVLAASQLRAAPASCLVVEDTPAGIAAGKAAGMTVLALATTHDQAQLADAHACLPTLRDANAYILEWTRN